MVFVVALSMFAILMKLRHGGLPPAWDSKRLQSSPMSC
jgi:hypothetical protein